MSAILKYDFICRIKLSNEYKDRVKLGSKVLLKSKHLIDGKRSLIEGIVTSSTVADNSGTILVEINVEYEPYKIIIDME